MPTMRGFNHPVTIAGLEGSCVAAGGLDPSYADPVSRDGLVADLLTARTLTAGNRALLAAAVLRSWVQSYCSETEVRAPLVEYRLWAGQRVEVSCA